MICTECDGRDEFCGSCGGTRRFEVIACPMAAGTYDVGQAIKAADRITLGRWPVAGGWLDQTMKCLEAVELIERDRAEWDRHNRKES